jgi:hypothetical protein
MKDIQGEKRETTNFNDQIFFFESVNYRLVGAFFLMCAIARFHGVINSNEKGAYRVFLWSCIIGETILTLKSF